MSTAVSTRTIAELNLGDYPLSLSPEQLLFLFGEQVAINETDHFCRVSPTQPQLLEVWVKTRGDKNYELLPAHLPTDWLPFTVDARYEDNDQPYTQTVLATDEAQAKRIVQTLVYYSNHGSDADPEEFYEMLDEDSLEVAAGYHSYTN
jgi:hypothetical protein